MERNRSGPWRRSVDGPAAHRMQTMGKGNLRNTDQYEPAPKAVTSLAERSGAQRSGESGNLGFSSAAGPQAGGELIVGQSSQVFV